MAYMQQRHLQQVSRCDIHNNDMQLFILVILYMNIIWITQWL